MTTDYALGTGIRLRTTSQSSNIMDSNETNVILLQASPLQHPYWQPVTINVGECSSASSSVCSTPVASRKRPESSKPPLPPGKTEATSSNRLSMSQRMSNNGSNSNLAKGKPRSRPSSLLVSDEHSVLVYDHLTPPASPKHHVAFRSHSADDDAFYYPKQPSTSLFSSLTSSLKSKLSNASLNEFVSESVSPTFLSTPASSIEKLNRLKDRLIRSVVTPASSSLEGKGDVDSDDESTPLVSEIATPTDSNCKEITARFLNQGFSSNSSDNSSSLKSTPMSPLRTLLDSAHEQDNGNATLIKMDDQMDVELASSCGSSVSLTNVLEPTSNYYHLVTVSGSMGSVTGSESLEVVDDAGFKLRKKSVSGHFSRQDAVDRSEKNKGEQDDVNNPETTV